MLPLENYITDDARNFISKKAIEGGYDFVFMMDDDMMFPSGCLATLLYSLIEVRKGYDVPTIVGGVYNRRGGNYEVLCYDFHKDKHCFTPKKVDLKNGLVKCDMLGTGCVLMDVSVFSNIDYPYFQYSYWPSKESEKDILKLFLRYDLFLKMKRSMVFKPSLDINGYNIDIENDEKEIFERIINKSNLEKELKKIEHTIKGFGKAPNHGIDRWGEDAVFFKKCFDAGIPVHIDTNVVCHHIARVLVTQKDRDNIAILSTAGEEI